jgi:hypothetical protein
MSPSGSYNAGLEARFAEDAGCPIPLSEVTPICPLTPEFLGAGCVDGAGIAFAGTAELSGAFRGWPAGGLACGCSAESVIIVSSGGGVEVPW